ncbi:MAG: FtsW/RodA/SpoVE family cell cycle protein [Bacteroidales bacterium]|nr:FtsW/RodA/SpoVE family cell cycle protein [Bacteroidales bacterium]
MITGKINGDKVIWVLVIILSAISLLAIYSATSSLAYRERGGNTEYYLIRQFVIVVLGLLIMFAVHRMNYLYFSRTAQFLFWASIALLIFTLLFGPMINGARRFLLINIPGLGVLTFQTSDMAKLALMMYLARFLAKNQEEIRNFKHGFIKIIVPILVVCGLILPSNFSTAAMLFVASLGILYIGRASIKHIGALIGIGALGFTILLSIAKFQPELLPRATTWYNRAEQHFTEESEPAYQVTVSKMAIASGRLWGKLPGNSTQRNFLPHSYSDFVYAIIIEEYGIIGGIFVIFLFVVLMFRSIKIARLCQTRFGSYLVVGISFLMVFQAMINMGVAVNLLPVTGQTLPFISMGGTSFWFSCAGLGIILSVSRSVEEKQAIQKDKVTYATA